MKYIKDFSVTGLADNVVTIGGQLVKNIIFNGETYTRDFESLDAVIANRANITAIYPADQEFPANYYINVSGAMGNFSLAPKGISVETSSSLVPQISTSITPAGQITFAITLNVPGEYEGNIKVTVVSTNHCVYEGEWQEMSVEQEFTFPFRLVFENVRVGVICAVGSVNDVGVAVDPITSKATQTLTNYELLYRQVETNDMNAITQAMVGLEDESVKCVIFAGEWVTTQSMVELFSNNEEFGANFTGFIFFGCDYFNCEEFNTQTGGNLSSKIICFTGGIRDAVIRGGQYASQNGFGWESYYLAALPEDNTLNLPEMFMNQIGNSGEGSIGTPDISVYMSSSWQMDGTEAENLVNAIISEGRLNEQTPIFTLSANVASAIGSALIDVGYNVVQSDNFYAPSIPVVCLTNSFVDGVDSPASYGVFNSFFGDLSNDFIEDLVEQIILGNEDIASYFADTYGQYYADEWGCYSIAFWDIMLHQVEQ